MHIVSPSRTKGILLHGGPPSEFVHRWRGRKQQHHRHMMRLKVTPLHAEVRPLKCVVYITRNPVTFVIHRRREFFLLDQQAPERKHQAAYKRHVHTPPGATCKLPLRPRTLLITDVTRLQPFTAGGDSLS